MISRFISLPIFNESLEREDEYDVKLKQPTIKSVTVINASVAVTLLEQRPEKIQALERDSKKSVLKFFFFFFTALFITLTHVLTL